MRRDRNRPCLANHSTRKRLLCALGVFWLHQILRRACGKRFDVSKRSFDDTRHGLMRVVGHMRRHDDVWEPQENMVCDQGLQIFLFKRRAAKEFSLFPDQGFVRKHIETGCAQLSAGQSAHQSGDTDDVAAHRIDKQRSGLHLFELRIGNKILGFRRRRKMERQDVGRCKNLAEGKVAKPQFCFRTLVRHHVKRRDFHPEASRDLDNSATDAARADDSERLAAQFDAS